MRLDVLQMKGVDGDSLLFKQVPMELCKGTNIDLSEWSLVCTDRALIKIGELNRLRMKKANSTMLTNKANSIKQSRWCTYRLKINRAQQVTDRGLAAIANACPLLEDLDIAHLNLVSDAVLRLMALKCTSLQKLNVSYCTKIKGAGIGAIADHCHFMKELALAGCHQLEEWVLQRVFYGMHQLLQIDLSNCPQVKNTTVKTMAYRCKQLQSIDLSNCFKLTDAALGHIAQHCRELKIFRFARVANPDVVTDTGLLSIGEHCHMLQELDISGCTFVSDVGITWLANGCTQLEILNLNRCHHVSDVGIHALSTHCEKLKAVHIVGLKAVSNVGLRYLATNCHNIQKLNLAGLYLVSDGDMRDFGLEGLQAVAKGCAGLIDLNLNQCFQVVEIALKAIASHCTALEKINLKGCKNVTEAGALHIVKGSINLKSLNLAAVGGCTNKVLKAISRNLAKLDELVISNCIKINDSGIAYLSKLANQLSHFDASGCEAVSNDGINAFSEHFRNPNMLHLLLHDCPLLSLECISKLTYRCPDLLTLGVRRCQISRAVLRRIATSWKYTELCFDHGKHGYYPRYRAKDRRFIDTFGALWLAAVKLQSLYRKRIAMKEYKQKQEIHLRNYVVTRLQSMWRARQDRRIATLRKFMFQGRYTSAVKIQRAYRKRETKRRVGKQMGVIYAKQLTIAALRVQRRWRESRRIAIVRAMNELRRTYMAKLAMHTLLVQRVWRGQVGRRKAAQARKEHKIRTQKMYRSATVIQSIARSIIAKRERKRLQRIQVEREMLRIQCALTIRRLFYRRKLYKEAERQRVLLEDMNAAAIRLQSRYRSRIAVKRLNLTRKHKQHLIEVEHVIKIQRYWRRRKGIQELCSLLQVRTQLKIQRNQSAVVLQSFFKQVMKIVFQREKLLALSRQKLAEETLLHLAATLVQTRWRKRLACRRVAQIRATNANTWKELVDIDNVYLWGPGALIYFNQLTAKVRRRPPREMLVNVVNFDCDQCGKKEGAIIECMMCFEYFCQECSDVVHGGGKRKEHTRRRLVDYYLRRIDYGDDDMVSTWKSVIEWDKNRGYDHVTQEAQENYDDEVERIYLSNKLRAEEAEAAIDEANEQSEEEAEIEEIVDDVSDTSSEWSSGGETSNSEEGGVANESNG